MADTETRLQEQILYYQARASEYDEWFMRLGRYDYGPELNAQWFAEIDLVRQHLALFNPERHVLELACGTGFWTEALVLHAHAITAVDASAEVIALNQQKLQNNKVTYVQQDLFTWQADQLYDVVFFSFWLSHVPPEKFGPFWEQVRLCLKPGGRVYFVDSFYSPTGTAQDQELNEQAIIQKRRLNDGSEFNIFKVYYQPQKLMADLAGLGWDIEVKHTPNYFLYGFGQVL